jgi:hypothetical protein
MLNNEEKKEFTELVEILETEQDVEIIFFEGSTTEKIGMRDKDDDSFKEDGFLKINFIIRDEELKFTNLFLKKPNQGTGTKVIEWFIKYCNNKNIDSILITGVNEANLISVKCCEKFKGEWENECDNGVEIFKDYRIKTSVL